MSVSLREQAEILKGYLEANSHVIVNSTLGFLTPFSVLAFRFLLPEQQVSLYLISFHSKWPFHNHSVPDIVIDSVSGEPLRGL